MAKSITVGALKKLEERRNRNERKWKGVNLGLKKKKGGLGN